MPTVPLFPGPDALPEASSPSLPAALERLVPIVVERSLHAAAGQEDPCSWLLHWLHTPMDDLDGRSPDTFIGRPHWDLIVAGLLIGESVRRDPGRLRRRSLSHRILSA